MLCSGGPDDNQCPKPDFCIKTKTQEVGKDGEECPAFCPTNCPKDSGQCPEGKNANGCELPGFCVPLQCIHFLN